MYQETHKRPKWLKGTFKTLAVIATFSMVFNMTSIAAVIQPAAAQASDLNEEIQSESLNSLETLSSTQAVCPVGDVKLNIGTGYEYTDNSATITGNGTTIEWQAMPGYEVTEVCVKIGGPGGGSLVDPNPLDDTYTTDSYDISHVVVHTEEKTTGEGYIAVKKDVRDQYGNQIDDDQIFYIELNNDESTTQPFSQNDWTTFTVPVSVTQTLTEVNLNPDYELVLYDKDEDINTPGAQITITEAEQTKYLLVKNKKKPGVCELEVTKSVNKEVAVPGDSLTYTFSYDNIGNANCTGGGVKIVDTVPTGTAYINNPANHSEPNGVAYNFASNTITWNLGTVEPDETGLLSYTVTINSHDQVCDEWTIENKAKSWSNEEGWKNTNTVTTEASTPCGGSIIVKKDVVNALDANDLSTFNFTLSVTQSDSFILGDNGQKIYNPATTGYYKVSEASDVDYDTQMVCTSSMNGFTPGYDHLAAESYADFTLRDGENVTCTFTNEFKVGALKVRKALDANGDGNYSIDDAQANILGFRWGFVGGTIDHLMHEIINPIATGAYSVTENDDAVPGYHFTGWYTMNSVDQSEFSCTNPEGITLPANVTVHEGDLVQLVFCNAKDDTTITFDKIVTGEPNMENQFTFTVLGEEYNDGDTGSFQVGVYQLTESGQANYSLVDAYGACSLSNGDISPVKLTVTGENETCTIVNERDTGSVEVRKAYDMDGNPQTLDDVIYDPDTWTWNLVGVENNIPAGETRSLLTKVDYSITENDDAEYNSSWTCNNGQVGQGTTITNLSVDKGEHVSCVFNNIRKFGEVTFEKIVPDGNPSDWTFEVNGQTYSHNQSVSLATGSYTVVEHGPDGYTHVSSTGICSNGSQGTADLTVSENGGTCTFTNDDIAPTITLIKEVKNDNGGTAKPDDFKLTIGGTPALSGKTYDVDANKAYALDETKLSGYGFVEIKGDAKCPAVLGGEVTLDEGENITCTIVNDDIAPKLTVIKHVVNDDGGTAVASNFIMNVTGTNVSNSSFAGAENPGVVVTLNQGVYSVDEDAYTGYAKTLGTDCSGTIANGETKTCTITNDDEPGRIVGYKFEDVDHSGDQNGNETGLIWTFYLRSGSQVGPIVYTTTSNEFGYFEFPSVDAGTYYLTEKDNPKWDMTVPAQRYYEVVVAPGYDNSQNDDEIGFIFGNVEKVTLELDKWNDQEVAHGGDGIAETSETINYQIDWSVVGNSIAHNVVLIDTIPAELNIDATSITASDGVTVGVWDASARTITWDFGTQQPNASGFVNYSATVIVPIANGTLIHNVAKISADNSDPQYLTDDSDVTVESAPVLGLVKSVDIHNTLGYVNPGDTITYTVVVTNTGTDTLLNVNLTDTLPDGFLFADTLTPTKLFVLGDIAVGASISTSYDVIVGANVAEGFYDNLAVATADNHNPVDDTATVEVRIPDTLSQKTEPRINLTKSVDVVFTNPGEAIEYKLKITLDNTGDAEALDIKLSDILPEGFTFEDGTTTRVWNLNAVPAGESRIITYKVKVASSVKAGTYLNKAVAKTEDQRVEASAPVEVRVPAVLGESVPKTGAGLDDLGIFIASLLMIVAGALFIHEGRKRVGPTQDNLR